MPWSHYFGINAELTEPIVQGLLVSLSDVSYEAKLNALVDAGALPAKAGALLTTVLCKYCFECRHANSLYMKEHLVFCKNSPLALKRHMASLIVGCVSLKCGEVKNKIIEDYAEQHASPGALIEHQGCCPLSWLSSTCLVNL
jgi:hypothetical protein